MRQAEIDPQVNITRQTTALTLPVLEFSIVISLALIVSGASLVALIGRVSVDIK